MARDDSKAVVKRGDKRLTASRKPTSLIRSVVADLVHGHQRFCALCLQTLLNLKALEQSMRIMEELVESGQCLQAPGQCSYCKKYAMVLQRK